MGMIFNQRLRFGQSRGTQRDKSLHQTRPYRSGAVKRMLRYKKRNSLARSAKKPCLVHSEFELTIP
jgi:hypothetical protein